jgi:CTP synthase (UTP-ammonia lyase)
MNRKIKVGIMGDFDPAKTSHPATIESIHHGAKFLSTAADIAWLPTPALLTEEAQERLSHFDCLWASAGSPYQSEEGMIKGIQIARELDKPFIAT